MSTIGVIIDIGSASLGSPDMSHRGTPRKMLVKE
jgi:hypothetical protein